MWTLFQLKLNLILKLTHHCYYLMSICKNLTTNKWNVSNFQFFNQLKSYLKTVNMKLVGEKLSRSLTVSNAEARARVPVHVR